MPETVLNAVVQNAELSDNTASMLAEYTDLPSLLAMASQLRDTGHQQRISYSRKVFIPLTQLCRDVCHYCTFAHPPTRGQRAYLNREEVLAIARA
ncbi:MAG: 7,8-didemethyl-8-hydroxy-5-deazariboflavin synthase, partial [Ktedonobacteraceae bacterium]